jgi:hypothetical protein
MLDSLWGNAAWVTIATVGFFTAKGLLWLAVPGLVWYRTQRKRKA